MDKTYYYVTGNTSKGLVNFLDSNLHQIKNVIVLKHPSLRVKTAVLDHLVKQLSNQKNIEILCSPFGADLLDGIINREDSVAIVSEDVIPAGTNLDVKEVDLELTIQYSEQDSATNREIYRLLDNAYALFADGLEVHDDLESIYIQNMDFDRANETTSNLIESLLNGAVEKEGKGHVFHRLFGTNTPDGSVNVLPSLLQRVNKKYYIKGRAGTGKSTLMKKVCQACVERGYDTELYHCSFDPNSIDMVLVDELGFAVFDSTDPHEFFPEDEQDIILDMYEKAVAPGTDDLYAASIHSLNEAYKGYMKKGILKIKDARVKLDEIEKKDSISELTLRQVTDQLLAVKE
ncbi:hypothetical protein [Virgibacillus sp. MG-45]|uniref:hypothetical protein n=1 Tax=Virgibacillus sp. MG-45 TaxID=3102791 RepID=UPI002EDA7A54